MTTTNLPAGDMLGAAAHDLPQPGRPRWLPALIALALLAVLATLLVQKDWSAALLGALAAAAGLLLGRASAASADPAGGGADGARLMVREIVPVWQRHVDNVRESAEASAAQVLEAFASLSEGLGTMVDGAAHLQPRLEAGAPDEMLAHSAEAIDRLLVPLQRAQADRQRMLEAMQGCGDDLGLLDALAKEVRSVATQTRIVAMNASIEASRGDADSGFSAVAQEVRRLSERTQEAGRRIGELVTRLNEGNRSLARDAELGTASSEELRLEARQCARDAIGLLTERLGDALGVGRELRQGSEKLRMDLDQVFVGMQQHDRTSQMLDAVGKDMARLQAWAEGQEPATHADAVRWLDALDRSYTMEEQRSRHHGAVQIERSTGVEFF